MKDGDLTPLTELQTETEELAGFPLNLSTRNMYQQEVKHICDDVTPGAAVPAPFRFATCMWNYSEKRSACIRRHRGALEDVGMDFPCSSCSEVLKPVTTECK